MSMEEKPEVRQYLTDCILQVGFPSTEGFQIWSGRLKITKQEQQWINIGQRDWILKEISLDDSLNSLSKLTEIRGLLLDWESDVEEEDPE